MWRVALADPIDPQAEAWLADRCTVVRATPGEPLAPLLVGCDGLIVRTTPVREADLSAADRLRVIVKHGSGTDNIDVAAARSRGVVVINSPGDNAAAVSEFALACILLMLRPIVEGTAWMRTPEAGRLPLVVGAQRAGLVGRELAAQTVGVVGWGVIGARVGRACAALGAKVIAFDPLCDADSMRASGAEPARDLRALLEAAHVVTLHVPLNDATRSMISGEEFAAMRPGVLFVNTSRGGVVDEPALVSALASGHVGAAATDVYATEPPAPDHPLLRMPNVLCTPHMAGATAEALERMGINAARAVIDALGA